MTDEISQLERKDKIVTGPAVGSSQRDVFAGGAPGTDASLRRWRTLRMEDEMTPAKDCYVPIRWPRMDSGRPAVSIRFRTATPMAASVCWVAKPRARSPGSTSALYRPIVVSTSARLPPTGRAQRASPGMVCSV
jgi:hypothetical protein